MSAMISVHRAQGQEGNGGLLTGQDLSMETAPGLGVLKDAEEFETDHRMKGLVSR